MGLFRICRPITVDAKQCTEPGTITTDLGFVNVKRGEWIVRGEDGETYILGDEFFRCTFFPLCKQVSTNFRNAAHESVAEDSKGVLESQKTPVRSCVQKLRQHRSSFILQKQNSQTR